MRKTDILWDIPVSLALLTRLPLPRLPDRCFQYQARAVWAFPLVGCVVSGLACLIAVAALRIGLTPPIAAGVLLATQLVLTGAMHEDGLADTADGFWGGFTPERRLEIMKDSQIGSYGVLALIVFVGLRWIVLADLLDAEQFGAVIGCAALSRAALPMMMTLVAPARDGGLSRSVGTPGVLVSALAALIGLIAAIILIGSAGLVATGVVALSAFGITLLAQAKIGGQTGDVLGATQVVGETLTLVALSAMIAQ